MMPEPIGCHGIQYVSLFGAIGYFVAAKRLMMGMAEVGIPFTWTPVFAHSVYLIEPWSARKRASAWAPKLQREYSSQLIVERLLEILNNV
ncbi:MAG: hypothetical protein HQM08_25905 [Candidatus Riflebacteria bacterium]|nr:hypothetical protein [Candidatus Riflebacteria bacterium]